MRILIVVVLAIVAVGSIFSGAQPIAIDRYLMVHNIPSSVDVKTTVYKGVFNDHHMFADIKDNAIYLLDMATMELKGKFFFRFGQYEGEIESLRMTAHFGNKLWVVDQFNRVTLFEHSHDKFVYKATFFLTPYVLVTNLSASQLGLFAFGRDTDGVFYLNRYSEVGVKLQEVKSFKPPLPGNIILSHDYSGNVFYSFQFQAIINHITIETKKNSTYKPDFSIRWSVEKNEMYKNGMVYNVGELGPAHLFISYWTVPTGGLFSIIEKKSKNVIASYTYPLAEGYIYKDRVYIYKESFQDRKMQSFLIEVRASDIIKK